MADEELEMNEDTLEEEDEEMEALSDDGDDDVGDSGSSETESAEEIAAAALAAQSSLAARNKVRDQMQAEIEAFLAKGGKIQQVEDNVMTDPPRKPTSSYGSRPI